MTSKRETRECKRCDLTYMEWGTSKRCDLCNRKLTLVKNGGKAQA